MRSLLMVMWIWVMVSCGGSGGDSAAVPGTTPSAALPANQLVFNSNRSGNHEIFTMQTDGSGARQLTKDARYDNWWPRISPDRSKVLLYRAPAGKSESYADASLWVVGVDGSGLTLLRDKGESGWTQQGHAEWSPDNRKIAMFGSAGASLQIFVTDAQGKNPVQYTNRSGINTDVSWSPNSTQLLFNGCPSTPCNAVGYEIYAMSATPLATPVRLSTNTLADYDPYFSPDGTRVAWLVNI